MGSHVYPTLPVLPSTSIKDHNGAGTITSSSGSSGYLSSYPQINRPMGYNLSYGQQQPHANGLEFNGVSVYQKAGQKLDDEDEDVIVDGYNLKDVARHRALIHHVV